MSTEADEPEVSSGSDEKAAQMREDENLVAVVEEHEDPQQQQQQQDAQVLEQEVSIAAVQAPTSTTINNNYNNNSEEEEEDGQQQQPPRSNTTSSSGEDSSSSSNTITIAAPASIEEQQQEQQQQCATVAEDKNSANSEEEDKLTCATENNEEPQVDYESNKDSNNINHCEQSDAIEADKEQQPAPPPPQQQQDQEHAESEGQSAPANGILSQISETGSTASNCTTNNEERRKKRKQAWLRIPNDIYVHTIPNALPRATSNLKDIEAALNKNKGELDPFLRESLEFYYGDWTVVDRKVSYGKKAKATTSDAIGGGGSDPGSAQSLEAEAAEGRQRRFSEHSHKTEYDEEDDDGDDDEDDDLVPWTLRRSSISGSFPAPSLSASPSPSPLTRSVLADYDSTMEEYAEPRPRQKRTSGAGASRVTLAAVAAAGGHKRTFSTGSDKSHGSTSLSSSPNTSQPSLVSVIARKQSLIRNQANNNASNDNNNNASPSSNNANSLSIIGTSPSRAASFMPTEDKSSPRSPKTRSFVNFMKNKGDSLTSGTAGFIAASLRQQGAIDDLLEDDAPLVSALLERRKEDELDLVRPLLAGEEFDVEALNAEECLNTMAIYVPHFKSEPLEHSFAERKPSSPFSLDMRSGFKLMFTCTHFEVYNHSKELREPLFFRAALYDIKNKQKLSEDFHFDLLVSSKTGKVINPEVFQHLDEQATAFFTRRTSKKPLHTGVFSIEEPNSQIVFVLFVDHIIQGSIDDAIKPYSGRRLGAAEVDKAWKRAALVLPRLYKYRQTILWGFLPLFPSARSSSPTFAPVQGAVDIPEFYRMAGDASKPFDIYEILESAQLDRSAVAQRFRAIPMKIGFQVTIPTEDNIRQFVNVPVQNSLADTDPDESSQSSSNSNTDDTNTEDRANSILSKLSQKYRIVDSIPVGVPRGPSICCRHILYLYPDTLNMAGYKGIATKAKNIAIKVYFRANDATAAGSITPRVRPSWLSLNEVEMEFSDSCKLSPIVDRYDENGRTDHAITNVTYHENAPQFLDEFKIELPLPFNERNHIVFLIYNINGKEKAKKNRRKSGSISSVRSSGSVSSMMTPRGPSTPSYPVAPASSSGLSVDNNDSDNDDSDKDDIEAPAMDSDDKAFRVLMGFAVLQLSKDGYILADGVHTLPIYKSLKPYYIDERVSQELETYNLPGGKKGTLSVRTRLVSTVYPQETAVRNLFQYSNGLAKIYDKVATENKSPNALKPLSKMPSIRATNNQHGLEKSSPVSVAPQNEQENDGNTSPSQSDSAKRPPKPLRPEDATVIVTSLNECLSKLREVNFDALVSQLPILLNVIFDCIIVATELLSTLPANKDYSRSTTQLIETRKLAFIFLLHIVRNTSMATKQYSRDNTVLNSYVHYVFKPPTSTKPFHWLLCDLWRELLENEDTFEAHASVLAHKKFDKRKTLSLKRRDTVSELEPQVKFGKVSVQFSWFLFDLMTKSLIMQRSQEEAIAETDNKENEYAAALLRFVEDGLCPYVFDMSKSFSKEDRAIATIANSYLALFFRDLVPLFSRQDIFKLVDAYATSLSMDNSKFTMLLRIDFFKMLADYEYFLPLNNPTNETDKSIKSPADLLIETVVQGISSQDVSIRQMALQFFVEHLTKIDYDARYQAPYKRNKIAGFYLGYVDTLSSASFFEKLLELNDRKDLTDCLVCAAFIMANASEKKLCKWWDTKVPQSIADLSSFVRLLSIMVVLFSRHGADKLRRAMALILQNIFLAFASWLKSAMDSGQLKVQRDATDKATIELNQEIDALMNECCQFLMNLQLTSPRMDRLITYALYSTTLQTFLRHFSQFLATSNVNNWRYLLGSVIVHTEFPANALTHRAVTNCFDLLKECMNSEYGVDLSFSSEEEEEGELEMSEDGKTKAGSLSQLLEGISAGTTEQNYNKIFFLTYLSFTTSYELLHNIIKKYTAATSDASVLRICNAVNLWVKDYFHDFDNRTICLLVRFLDEVCALSHKPSMNKFTIGVKKILQKKLLEAKLNRREVKQPGPDPIVPKGFDAFCKPKFDYTLERYRNVTARPYDAEFNILDWSSVEIARQMTLIEFEHFKQIQPKECFGQAWTKADKDVIAKNIAGIADRFNKVSQWVATTIMREQDIKRRRALICKFIDIANCNRALNNFCSINQICSALNSASVYRLKKTWKGVPEADKQKKDEFSNMLNHPYQELRKTLAKCTPPCVPFIGMYLTDLMFIEQGNPDMLRGKINFFKRRLYSEVILEIQSFQQKPYELQNVPYLRWVFTRHIFEEQHQLDDNELFKLSLQAEPRGEEKKKNNSSKK